MTLQQIENNIYIKKCLIIKYYTFINYFTLYTFCQKDRIYELIIQTLVLSYLKFQKIIDTILFMQHWQNFAVNLRTLCGLFAIIILCSTFTILKTCFLKTTAPRQKRSEVTKNSLRRPSTKNGLTNSLPRGMST